MRSKVCLQNMGTIEISEFVSQGKISHTINLNTVYLVLFKNPRDKYQVLLMVRKMFPGKSHFFMDCFDDVTSVPYGYLMIDLKAKKTDDFRLRTDLFSDMSVVYVHKRK